MTSTKPGTQRAGRLSFWNQSFDDGIRIALFNVKRNAGGPQILGQDMGGISRLFLIQVDRNDIEVNRRPTLERQ
jgi:hypothetical protein